MQTPFTSPGYSVIPKFANKTKLASFIRKFQTLATFFSSPDLK